MNVLTISLEQKIRVILQNSNFFKLFFLLNRALVQVKGNTLATLSALWWKGLCLVLQSTIGRCNLFMFPGKHDALPDARLNRSQKASYNGSDIPTEICCETSTRWHPHGLNDVLKESTETHLIAPQVFTHTLKHPFWQGLIHKPQSLIISAPWNSFDIKLFTRYCNSHHLLKPVQGSLCYLQNCSKFTQD